MSIFWGPGTVLNTIDKVVNDKSNRERQISYDITYTQNLKKIQMDLLAKQKQTHRENKFFGVYMHTHIHIYITPNSLCHKLETNTILYVNYTSKKAVDGRD